MVVLHQGTWFLYLGHWYLLLLAFYWLFMAIVANSYVDENEHVHHEAEPAAAGAEEWKEDAGAGATGAGATGA